MATIKDIARIAGVSIATVSRVLNNHEAVNETTRSTVLRVAQELEYPLENIQKKQQFNRTVLVITREEERASLSTGQSGMREFERNVWGGVHHVLETHGISTRLQQSRMTPYEAEQYANDVTVSGLILLGGVINPDFVLRLIEHEVPFVVAGSHLHPMQINAVMADVAQGIRQAVTYLIQQGRQHIGFVNGPASTQTSAEKLDGLRLTLTLHDLPFNPASVVASEFSSEDGYYQTMRLLDQLPALDAVVYAEDTIAMGGISALKERGLSVPGDVAVIGFGDYDIARFIDPPLTTIQFDMRAMGRIAARRLSALLEEPDDDVWLMRTPASLVIRQSA